MTDFEIPAAMVEVGRAALGEYLTALALASPDERDEVCDRATTYVLAAALSVCEVREELGMRQTNAERLDLSGDLWASDRQPVPWDMADILKEWRDVGPPWSCTGLRRLHVTTPAEQVDTEGAKT